MRLGSGAPGGVLVDDDGLGAVERPQPARAHDDEDRDGRPARPGGGARSRRHRSRDKRRGPSPCPSTTTAPGRRTRSPDPAAGRHSVLATGCRPIRPEPPGQDGVWFSADRPPGPPPPPEGGRGSGSGRARPGARSGGSATRSSEVSRFMRRVDAGSGRSVSSNCRDFRAAFGPSPGRTWAGDAVPEPGHAGLTKSNRCSIIDGPDDRLCRAPLPHELLVPRRRLGPGRAGRAGRRAGPGRARRDRPPGPVRRRPWPAGVRGGRAPAGPRDRGRGCAMRSSPIRIGSSCRLGGPCAAAVGGARRRDRGRPAARSPTRRRAKASRTGRDPERARLPGHREAVKEDRRGIGEGQRGPHLVLLARDAIGYRSLCRLALAGEPRRDEGDAPVRSGTARRAHRGSRRAVGLSRRRDRAAAAGRGSGRGAGRRAGARRALRRPGPATGSTSSCRTIACPTTTGS